MSLKIEFDRDTQTRIFELGSMMVHGSFIDQLWAEHELREVVKGVVEKIEQRKPQPPHGSAGSDTDRSAARSDIADPRV